MIECPSCGRPQQPLLICPDCGSPLAAPLDCFAALGIPRTLTIDLDALERRYHELSRKLHPDRFASSAAPVRDASLRATATLTRSYRTIRDPVARGLYWLELIGEKLSENNKRVPPELAELVFEVQEQLAGMHDAPADSDAARELAAQVAQRRAQLQATMDASLADLERNFVKWDQRSDEKMLTLQLKAVLSSIAYLRTLIRDVDRALENSKAA
ncbi:MAG: Fe-S protein assembly co-chaperone HscB [Candidatus Binatus sp.]|uniref:Fe-S protein assembly co-chaperone HscB n=1 Tax=Candidatus Binatus sp. TaxID=2811406 RepID=UPI003C77CECC